MKRRLNNKMVRGYTVFFLVLVLLFVLVPESLSAATKAAAAAKKKTSADEDKREIMTWESGGSGKTASKPRESRSATPTGDLIMNFAEAGIKNKSVSEVSMAKIHAEKKERKEDTLFVNEAYSYLYYDSLPKDEKVMYEAILEAEQYPGRYVPCDLRGEALDEAFYEKVFKIELCISWDHPELFYLYYASGSPYSLKITGQDEDADSMKTVYFFVPEFEEYEMMMTAFNDAVEEFMSDIDLKKPEDEIALQIHDKLIDLCIYDYAACDKPGLAHTAYGALVGSDSGSNYCVCDGYSQAYAYLLQQAGIVAGVVGGFGGPSVKESGGHAWNIVYIEDAWTEIDVTWDDSDPKNLAEIYSGKEYEYTLRLISDPDYRDTLYHTYFMKSSLEMFHIERGEECLYNIPGVGKIGLNIGELYHFRDYLSGMNTDVENPFIEVSKLLPWAE